MKTKKQLLKICKRMNACSSGIEYINQHPSNDAYGVLENLTEWQIWFLSRRLTRSGLDLLAKRLGCKVDEFYYEQYFGPCPHEERDDAVRKGELRGIFRNWRAYERRGRKVINDCWRAWCRS